MSHKEGLLLLGVLIALICVPAAVTATGGGGDGCCPYIKVVLDEPKGYLNLEVETIDALDPLDVSTTSVTLKSTEPGDLKPIEGPLLGDITRKFCPNSGTYHGAEVTVMDKKTIDGKTIPCHQYVYITPTIPSFTVNVPGECGNVLLIKCPEDIDSEASFTEIINDAEKEGYLFTKDAIIYYNGTSITAYGAIDGNDYSKDALHAPLVNNEVDLG